MNPSTGWTIGGAITATTAPLTVSSSQASLTADLIPIYSAALAGTYAINIENLLGISSQVVSISDPQTLVSKTLTAPAISSPVLSGTVTGTYTLGGTPTLTSPTINTPAISGGSLAIDVITGKTVTNTGTIYGMAITTGQITGSQITTNGIAASNLATNAILLAYIPITNSFTTTSTTPVQVTGLSATVTVPAGSRSVKISAYFPFLYSSSSTIGAIVTIWRGNVGSGTQLQLGAGFGNQSNQDAITSTYMQVIDTPSAGSVTYNIGLNVDVAATGTIAVASTQPAYILVELD